MEHVTRCIHARDGICRHAKLPRVAVTVEGCAACPLYAGRHRGLGDVIHTVAQATGVARVVKAVGGDCGCQKRREALNQKFPKAP